MYTLPPHPTQRDLEALSAVLHAWDEASVPRACVRERWASMVLAPEHLPPEGWEMLIATGRKPKGVRGWVVRDAIVHIMAILVNEHRWPTDSEFTQLRLASKEAYTYLRWEMELNAMEPQQLTDNDFVGMAFVLHNYRAL